MGYRRRLSQLGRLGVLSTSARMGGERPHDALDADPYSVTNLAIFAGALASALLSRQFSIRRAPAVEYAKGLMPVVILMGAGAALAGGCNVGGFYSAIGVFSMGGLHHDVSVWDWVPMLGLKYLLWEMEHLPPTAATCSTGQRKRIRMVRSLAAAAARCWSQSPVGRVDCRRLPLRRL